MARQASDHVDYSATLRRQVAVSLSTAPITSYGARYLDRLYGPGSVEIRKEVASVIHGCALTKSARLCQYGNLRAALVELFGATGSCIAAVDTHLQELIEAQLADATAR